MLRRRIVVSTGLLMNRRRAAKRAYVTLTRARPGTGLLALLVWVNLSLVCQGHAIGPHTVGPHLTVLEIFDHHDEIALEQPTGTADRLASAGANMLGVAYNPEPETLSASMLGFVFLLSLALGLIATRPAHIAPMRLLITQCAIQPEPPPPR